MRKISALELLTLSQIEETRIGFRWSIGFGFGASSIGFKKAFKCIGYNFNNY